MPPAEVVKTLTAADAGREHRQLHVMDAAGRIAAHTGADCIDWCGHTASEGFSVAGNMLAGPRVIDETAEAYRGERRLPFPRRLIAALKAGEAAGGDKRGKQSAALVIYGEDEWPDLDLRVDDHADPLAELERLEAVSRERWVHFRQVHAEPRNPVRRHRPRRHRGGDRQGAGCGGELNGDASAPSVARMSEAKSGPASQGPASPSLMRPTQPLLAIENLRVSFHGDRRAAHRRGRRRRLCRVARGATLGLVGESGCGKSVTSLAVMGLLPKRTRRGVRPGHFDGIELLDLPDRELRDLRGDRLAMIFQEPMTSLNPSYTIGEQIIEVLVRHRGLSQAQARERAIALLDRAGIPSPAERIDDYPHKLSGGMRQRAMIAIALACDPRAADRRRADHRARRHHPGADPRSDARAQAHASGAAIILITHDLGVVAEVCDEVAVMYAGEIVERAPADALFEAPGHPYTVGLLASIPRLDRRADRLAAIDGVLPDMTAPPDGCRFATAVRSCWRSAAPRRRRSSRSPRALVALPAGAAGAGGGVMKTSGAGVEALAAASGSIEAFPMTAPLVEAEGLVKHFVARRSIFGRPTAFVKAVDGVSFTVEAGKTLALVGESGSGKSTVGRAGAAADRADRRAACAFAGQDVFALGAAGTRAYPPPGAARVPGPVRVAQSAHDGRRHPGRAARAARHRAGRAARASASPAAGAWSGSSRASRRAIRTSSPAASASAS